MDIEVTAVVSAQQSQCVLFFCLFFKVCFVFLIFLCLLPAFYLNSTHSVVSSDFFMIFFLCVGGCGVGGGGNILEKKEQREKEWKINFGTLEF